MLLKKNFIKKDLGKLTFAIYQALYPHPIKRLIAAGLLSVSPTIAVAVPSVTNQTPAINALTALKDDNIVVDFNENIKSASVTSSSFIVTSSLSGPHTGTFVVSGSQITLNPTEDFKVGETVTITLTTGIQNNASSTPMAIPQTWQFIVQVPTISPGYFLDSGQGIGNSESRKVKLGDLDGDGDLDAFIANKNQANRVWFNNGSGIFTDSGQNLGNSDSSDIVLGDVNGDGNLDAFVANNGQANILWLNNGFGNFTDSGENVGNAKNRGIALGDLDGDGDLDAFIITHNQDTRVWLNSGSGTFTDSIQSLGSYKGRSIALGDLDGDYDLDVFISNLGDSDRVLFNDGSGTFTDTGQTVGIYKSYDVNLGDLDGDGNLDAFVANTNNKLNRLWFNNGLGTSFLDSGQNLGSFWSTGATLGDVDGDGDLDVFVVNGDNQGNQVWLNDGFGIFTDSGYRTGNDWSFDVELGDLDGDGDLDAFIANSYGSGQNRVLLNIPPLLISASTPPTPIKNDTDAAKSSDIVVTFEKNVDATTVDTNSFIVTGSLSGLINGSLSTTTNTVMFNPTNDFREGETITVTLTTAIKATDTTILATPQTWQFTVQAPVLSPSNFIDSGQNFVNFGYFGVALGDVDGDGDLDTFGAGGYSNVWLNDGSSQLTDTGQSVGSWDARNLAMGDLDGDGDLDTFVANWNNESNSVWFNNGSGIFADSGQSLGSSLSYNVTLGDVDGDGDLDAFISNFGKNKVWLNDGAGNFIDSGQNLGNSSSTGVSLRDIDDDGDLDAFVANTGKNRVWFNDGFGNFTNSGQNLGNSSSNAVAMGDIDGNGTLDAFIANNWSDNIVWLNDGSGTFTNSGQSLGSFSGSYDVTMGDIDGDGDLDAFVANNGSNRLWVNNGSGIFIDNGQTLGSNSSLRMELGDLDGDGDLDAFVGNGWDGTYNRVWLNTTIDLGDLPVVYNLSTLANDGARHTIPLTGNIYFGTNIDDEADGQVSINADSDNINGTNDEDGISVPTINWIEGTNGGSIQVVVTGGNGYLSGWIDWNNNNDFLDTGEQVFNMLAVTVGTQTLPFDIPSGVLPIDGINTRFARFRLDDSDNIAMTTTGLVTNGEVEDYKLTFTTLNAPTNLIATVISQTQINLSWTDISGIETGFKIERNGVPITTTSADETSYNDTELTCNKTYNYSVITTDGSNDSAIITISDTTQACPIITSPTVYHKLTIEKNGNGTIISDYGMNCGTDCEYDFADQTEVSLTATPDTDWSFTGWTGDCDAEGSVRLHQDKTCIATFESDIPLIEEPIIPVDNTNVPTEVIVDKPVYIPVDTDTSTDIPPESSNELVIDGNGDGILDNKQIYVITIPDAITGEYITIASHIGCPIKIASAHTEQEQVFESEGYTFPQGIVYYEIQCPKVNITMYFHGMSRFRTKPVYKKFGPLVPDDLSTLTWYTLPNVVFATTIVNGKQVATAKFTLKDGELGDNTGIDGKIIDPGGIGFED